MSYENDSLFNKEKKKCEAEIKEQINKIIKNNGNFCCMSKDISIIIPDKSEEAEPSDTLTKYLPTEEGNKWIRLLFLETLKSKELNVKALEQMKAKGITPKPQPLDILLIIIIPAEKSIKIGISIPTTIDLDLLNCCKNSLIIDKDDILICHFLQLPKRPECKRVILACHEKNLFEVDVFRVEKNSF